MPNFPQCLVTILLSAALFLGSLLDPGNGLARYYTWHDATTRWQETYHNLSDAVAAGLNTLTDQLGALHSLVSGWAPGTSTTNFDDSILTNPIKGVRLPAARNRLFPFDYSLVSAQDYGPFGRQAPGFGACSIKEAYPQRWGTGATAIKAACDSLVNGGTVRLVAGTYTIDSAIIISNDKVELKLDDGAVLNSTAGDTDFTIKITGNYCAVTGPGKISCPNNPSTPAGSIDNLRKAIIWNTGQHNQVNDLVFENIPTFAIHNEQGNRT